MRSAIRPLLTTLCLGLGAGCTEDKILTPPPPPPPAPTQAILVVNTITTGNSPDADGYLLTMDGENWAQLAPTDEREFKLEPGSHVLGLTGVANNCESSGPNPFTTTFVAGQRVAHSFQLHCPSFATVQIITTTTGPNPDTDGYVLTVGGVILQQVESAGQIQLSDIRSGFYTYRLSSVAGNCSVVGGSTRTVFVEEGEAEVIHFDVQCVPRTEDLPGEKLVVSSREDFGIDANLEILNTDGSGRQRLTDDVADEQSPEISPDGSRILFLEWTGNASTRKLMVFDRVLHTETTLPTQRVDRAVWSPDGSRIAFMREGRLHLMNADGTGELALIPGGFDSDPYWSPDGAHIAFTRSDRVWVVDANGANLHAVGPSNRKAGPWSPDGQKLIATTLTCTYYYWYCYYGLSLTDLVILRIDNGIETAITSSIYTPEWSPVWSADGTQIYYLAAPNGNPDVFRIPARAGEQPVNLTNSPAREEWVSLGVVPPQAALRASARSRRP